MLLKIGSKGEDVKKLQLSHPKKVTIVYDEKESGASLTWKFLFPKQQMPLFIRYIKDNDIEEWVKRTEGMSLSHLKEVLISVIVMGRSFEETISNLEGLKIKPTIKTIISH